MLRTSVILAALAVLSSGAGAQVTGTITGTIYDASGAVLPKAKVILTNQASKDTRQTVSNEAGYFTFAAVLTGTYTVRVEVQGFKTWEVKGLVMNAGDKRHYPIKLEVGSVNNEVTVVAADAEITPVDSGERSAVLSSKQIQNLSLMGRDVTELIKILPGMSVFGGGIGNTAGFDPTRSGIGSAVGNGFTANGAPNRGGTDIVSDGAHIIDSGCNCNATAQVNADMVQEVKVQTSNFGADSAKGPVVINAVGKSGSSEFHGQGYIQARDSAFNSTDSFVNSHGGTKPRDRYLYPGFNVGGPVMIPGTKFNSNKKLMFWAGYEYYYQKLPADAPLTAYVPTAGMREGNFSPTGAGYAELCNNRFNMTQSMCTVPTGMLPNGTPITGGIIPQNQIDPGARALLKMIPMPNANPADNNGFNYFEQILTQLNGSLFRTRLDYNLSDNTKFYVSYQRQGQTSETPVHLYWTPTFSARFPGGGMVSGDRSHTVSGTFLHTFSPTLTNEAVVAFAYLNLPNRLVDANAWSREALGYPYRGVFNTGSSRMPGLTNNYYVPGYPQIDMPDLFSANGGAMVLDKVSPSFQNNLTKVFRTHTIKTGFYTEKTVNDQGAWSYINGQVFFAPNSSVTTAHPEGIGTANAVANMMLGVAGSYYEESINAVTYMSYRTYSGFVQDSWKFNKRLTLDLGLRFDHSAPWKDDSGKAGMAVWMPERYAADVAAGKELPGVYWNGRDSSIPIGGAPSRFAYVSPRLGAAFDLFGTGNTILRGGWGAYRWHESYNDVSGALITALGARSYRTPNAMYLSEIDALGRGAAGLGGLASGAYTVDPKDDERPVTYSYNFTISQRLPGKSLLEVAYTGNNTKHLPLQGDLTNLNLVPAGALFNPDPVTNAPANPLDADANNYRPYRAFGENLRMTRYLGYANYNALQVSWNKQGGRLTYALNYTWSKALGIHGTTQLGGALNDANNLANNYGVLSSDRSHVINTSYMYELGRFYPGANKLLGGLANGWAISGITTWQSGPNLQASSNSNFYLNLTSSTGTRNPNNRSWLGTPNTSLQPVLTCDPRQGLQDNQFINASCFTLPGQGQNGVFQMPYIHGPAYFSSDLTVSKTFKITERQNMQLRLSALNWMNHALTSFNANSNDNVTLRFTESATNPGQWNQTNQFFGMADANYGRRVLSLTLKYSF
ncbi:MAG TPA: carboxypeptidase-like regulatory domain-containing protein [Blastocatellia bacterium]|nr:carboxypeptidase-like regulatory domain-containing protein [Blastocatellia bacterium]